MSPGSNQRDDATRSDLRTCHLFGSDLLHRDVAGLQAVVVRQELEERDKRVQRVAAAPKR